MITEVNVYEKKYQFKNWNHRRWLKLFFHNFEASGGFLSEEEALSSSNPNKYSILAELSDALKFNETFEFLLEYETYKIHWQQRDNPLKINDSINTEVPGLNVFLNKTNGVKFEGLMKQTSKPGGIQSSLLDGNKGADWFYAIGMYNYTHDSWYKNGPPGAGSAEKTVSLWTRVPLYFGIHRTCCRTKNYLRSVLFICVALAS